MFISLLLRSSSSFALEREAGHRGASSLPAERSTRCSRRHEREPSPRVEPRAETNAGEQAAERHLSDEHHSHDHQPLIKHRPATGRQDGKGGSGKQDREPDGIDDDWTYPSLIQNDRREVRLSPGRKPCDCAHERSHRDDASGMAGAGMIPELVGYGASEHRTPARPRRSRCARR